jgi:putative ABC transport system substrate-binding protein
MKRRKFIAVLGGAAIGLPLAVRAQKAAPVIAILGSGAVDTSSSRMQMSLLGAAMTELDLVAGRDYVFEIRWADSDVSRFAALAADLVAGNPRAVVVSTNPAAFAVQKLSRNVPIVGTGLNMPVAVGLAASLARPGGNVTGVATMAEDLQLKLLEMLRETLPTVRRVMAIANPANSSHAPMLEILIRQAAATEILVEAMNVDAPDDLDAVFDKLSRQPAGALFVLSDNSLLGLSEPIVTRALALRVPAFGNFAEPFARARPQSGLSGRRAHPEKDPRGHNTRRYSVRAADQVQPVRQPQDGESARHRDSGEAARDSGRRDRMKRRYIAHRGIRPRTRTSS